MLTQLKLKPPTLETVFRNFHYNSYLKIVIRSPHIKKIIEEASKWKNSRVASEHLTMYLKKIREIEEEAKMPAESYESFFYSYQSSFDYYKHCQQLSKQEQLHQPRHKKQQNQNSSAGGNVGANGACGNVSN